MASLYHCFELIGSQKQYQNFLVKCLLNIIIVCQCYSKPWDIEMNCRVFFYSIVALFKIEYTGKTHLSSEIFKVVRSDGPWIKDQDPLHKNNGPRSKDPEQRTNNWRKGLLTKDHWNDLIFLGEISLSLSCHWVQNPSDDPQKPLE